MGRKLLLEHINVPGINTFDVYRSKGGYAAVEKALKTLTPEEVVEEVKNRAYAAVAVQVSLPG
jgi:NADH-quinone oxidoreductase subunit F